MKLILAVLFATVLFVCSSCGTSTGTSSKAPIETHRIKVVASYSILGDWVRNVGGDAIELQVLSGAGADPHTFEPAPKHGVALADAAVVFENGLEFENWLDKLFTASGCKGKRVIISSGIAPLSLDDHGRKETDPHIWHDVGNAIIAARIIEKALCEALPENSATFRANTEKYIAQLSDLDTWVLAEVAKLPVERRKLVTSHDTFGYFSKHYGFTVVGSAFGSVSTEVGDPSAKKISELIEQIKPTKVPAVFAENVQNPALMQRVAKEAGVEFAPPLYTDALGETGSDGDTYIKMVHFNVSTIVKALNK